MVNLFGKKKKDTPEQAKPESLDMGEGDEEVAEETKVEEPQPEPEPEPEPVLPVEEEPEEELPPSTFAPAPEEKEIKEPVAEEPKEEPQPRPATMREMTEEMVHLLRFMADRMDRMEKQQDQCRKYLGGLYTETRGE